MRDWIRCSRSYVTLVFVKINLLLLLQVRGGRLKVDKIFIYFNLILLSHPILLTKK
jgi:hypothetical protein